MTDRELKSCVIGGEMKMTNRGTVELLSVGGRENNELR